MEEFVARQDELYHVTEGFVTKSQIEYLQTLLIENKEVKKVMETGFNGGHSAVAMLSARKDVVVTSFDIGSHVYIEAAKKLVDEMFPGRHTLVLGDSTETLTECQEQFDFAFIDGGHSGEVPESDIRNAVRLVREGGIIVVDDVCNPCVNDAYHKVVSEGVVRTKDAGGPVSTNDRSWVALERV